MSTLMKNNINVFYRVKCACFFIMLCEEEEECANFMQVHFHMDGGLCNYWSG